MVDKEQQPKTAQGSDVLEGADPNVTGGYIVWDNNTATVPEHYVKAFMISSDSSDVTLLLGNTFWESGSRVDLCKLRLLIAHRAFLEFAEEVQRQADFLRIIYKGTIPGPDPTSEEFDSAMEEIYGND